MLLELGVAQLVAGLELSVVIKLLLDCIVGQVHIPIRHVLQREFTAGGTQVAFAVPVALQVTIYATHEGETTDVEFPVFVQERLLDVLLYNIASSIAINISVLHQAFDMLKIFTDLNATASVCVLARLDDPQALSKLLKSIENGLFRWI